VLVWNENYGDNDIVVFRAFQGGDWTQWRSRYLGDDLPYAARTRAVVARAGEPVLAWGEYLRKPDGSRLTVRAWTGTTWSRSAPFNDLKQFSRTPALALNGAGNPVVAWLQGDVLASDVLVSRWTGEQWERLGPAVNRRGRTYLASTRLVLDRAGSSGRGVAGGRIGTGHAVRRSLGRNGLAFARRRGQRSSGVLALARPRRQRSGRAELGRGAWRTRDRSRRPLVGLGVAARGGDQRRHVA
jgi:hypothetical protein